jgi:hypothetical protein
MSENGMIVYADYTGVPEWLGKIMPYAFPSRSIEGFWDIESKMGRKYRFVLSACKILGLQWPGVNQLEDLPMYYGEQMPASVVVEPELAAAVAAGNLPGGDPMKFPWRTAATANLDDIRRSFTAQCSKGTKMESWWIRQVLVDPNEIVVEDDQDGKLYRLSFQTDASGNVSFSEPESVRIGLIPDDQPELMKAAASHSAEILAIGRHVLASYSTRAESSPDNTGGAMDPKEVRKQLSLPEDASDEQVHLALLTKAGLAEPAAAVTPAPELVAVVPAAVTPEPAATPVPAPAPAAVAEPAAVAASALNLPPGVIALDEGTFKTMQETVTKASSFIDKQEERDRSNVVMAAISDGRIPPASKDHWLNLLKLDPNAEATLASLQSVVPVKERGHGHSVDGGGTDVAAIEDAQVAEWTHQLFPETQQPVAAAGQFVSTSRIASDGHYTRGR